eukprot:TRINITY_DN4215_c0_g3_i2.p2 TRINITY_DN4215_c0_g3~~TRINITY_DN4215_c0_g3_i2.p2  ORF type:complete len:104 (-),score=31.52 TRINITY_DN4215_c0_g3_i2:37-348(-)
MSEGGILVDHHSCDFFPERWFDFVFVLQTNNTILYDRLEKRGYKQNKITENVECEIFQTVLFEAQESYKEEIVFSLVSETVNQLEPNCNLIKEKVDDWIKEKN